MFTAPLARVDLLTVRCAPLRCSGPLIAHLQNAKRTLAAGFAATQIDSSVSVHGNDAHRAANMSRVFCR
jgi:hypothetical protein